MNFGNRASVGFLFAAAGVSLAAPRLAAAQDAGGDATDPCASLPVGAICDDQNDHTYLDRCDAANHCVGLLCKCTVDDPDCQDYKCLADGDCEVIPKKDGLVCNPAKACKVGTCSSGYCHATLEDTDPCSPVDLQPSENGDCVDTATGSTGKCSSGECLATTFNPDTTTCNDDLCLSGLCDASGHCTLDTPWHEGLGCASSSDPCLPDAKCQSGVCTGTRMVCADGPCTKGSCTDTGCLNTPVPEGTSCQPSTNDPCTIGRCDDKGVCAEIPNALCSQMPTAAGGINVMRTYGGGCSAGDARSGGLATAGLLIVAALLCARRRRAARVLALAVLAGAAMAPLTVSAYSWRPAGSAAGANSMATATTASSPSQLVAGPSLLVGWMPFVTPQILNRVDLGLSASYSKAWEGATTLGAAVECEWAAIKRWLSIGTGLRTDVSMLQSPLSTPGLQEITTVGGFRGFDMGLKAKILDDGKGNALALGVRSSVVNLHEGGASADGMTFGGGALGIVTRLPFQMMASVGYFHEFAVSNYAYPAGQFDWAFQPSFVLGRVHYLLASFAGDLMIVNNAGYAHRVDVGFGYQYVGTFEKNLFKFGALLRFPVTHRSGDDVGGLLNIAWEF